MTIRQMAVEISRNAGDAQDTLDDRCHNEPLRKLLEDIDDIARKIIWAEDYKKQ